MTDNSRSNPEPEPTDALQSVPTTSVPPTMALVHPTDQKQRVGKTPKRGCATKRPRFLFFLFVLALMGEHLAAGVLAYGTVFLSSVVHLPPERGFVFAGLAAVLVALGAGFLAAAVARKIGTLEILASGAMFVAWTTWALSQLLRSAMDQPGLAELSYLAGMLGNPIGGVAIAGITLWGATFVGGSLGFLLAGSGKIDLRFSFELFVALRHLRLRKKSPTMIMTIISIGGVTVGVLALTVVLSVMSGFELDLKQKIIGTNAHAVVSKYGADFSEWAEVVPKIREVKGVTGVTPFIMSEVLISSEQNPAGALIKGIDTETVAQVSNLPANVKKDAMMWLDHPEKIPDPVRASSSSLFGPGGAASKKGGSATPKDGALTEEDIIGSPKKDQSGKEPNASDATPGILLGRELAHSLRVAVGDRINVVTFRGGDLGPSGPIPKSRPFKVAGLVYTGMYEYDMKFAYVALAEAQKFFDLGQSITGLELKTDDIDNTRQITRNVLSNLDGYPYRTKDWGEMNKNLFSALRLEKLVMAVILAFIVLVACFNIVSTLIMMVLEKSKEIAILKSMGSTDTSVMKVFVLEGLVIGVIGTAIGLALGYLTCLLVEVVGIGLDAEVYYIDRLPVKIEPLQFALVAFVAILLSYLATILPATRASRVAPVDGLRNE